MEEENKEEVLTHKEVSSRGGKTTLERKGQEFYKEIGRRGGSSLKRKYGPEYYRKLQKLSTETKRKNKEEKEKQAQIGVLTDNH